MLTHKELMSQSLPLVITESQNATVPEGMILNNALRNPEHLSILTWCPYRQFSAFLSKFNEEEVG